VWSTGRSIGRYWQLERGDEMVPLGKVSGAGEDWYMVKTKGGVIGWVRGVEVEEVSRQK
jgi:hypothetical protein